MTLEEFKKLKIESMKARDNVAVNAYNAIISKLMLAKIEKKANGEDLTEADVTSCLKKTQKELIEEKEGYEKAGREENVSELNKQLEIIEKYIPKMMSAEQIKEEIEKLQDKSMPSVMKHFKTNFAGKVEMKTVSEVLKSL